MRKIFKNFLLFTSFISITCFLCACNTESTKNTSEDSAKNSTQETTKSSLEKALELERPYYDTIENAIKALEKTLKNPKLLQVNDIILFITKGDYYSIKVLFDYNTATTAVYGSDLGIISSDMGLYDTSKEIIEGHNSKYTEEEEGYYVQKNWHVFRLNIEDYLNEGYYFP